MENNFSKRRKKHSCLFKAKRENQALSYLTDGILNL